MKITNELTDHAVLVELGRRIANCRLERNVTQEALAGEAGVSKRTIERIESGTVATQLSSFVRVLRALGLQPRFDLLVPEPGLSPVAQLHQQRHRRQRARERPSDRKPERATQWTWGEAP